MGAILFSCTDRSIKEVNFKIQNHGFSHNVHFLCKQSLSLSNIHLSSPQQVSKSLSHPCPHAMRHVQIYFTSLYNLHRKCHRLSQILLSTPHKCHSFFHILVHTPHDVKIFHILNNLHIKCHSLSQILTSSPHKVKCHSLCHILFSSPCKVSQSLSHPAFRSTLHCARQQPAQ